MKKSTIHVVRAVLATAVMMAMALSIGGCLFNEVATVTGPGLIPRVEGSPYAAFSPTQLDGYFELDGSLSWDDDGDVISWIWDFGDGQTAGGPFTSHVYYTDTPVLLRLTVTDNDGLQADTVLTLYPDPTTGIPDIDDPVVPGEASLVAKFTWEQGHGAWEYVRFNGRRTAPVGNIKRCKWEFGDGDKVTGAWVRYVGGERISVERETKHRYTSPGNYVVTLTVWDYDGNKDTVTHTVVIR